jgi:hypothetical protein
MRHIIVILDIEAKDEYEGGAGYEPEPEHVAAYAQDILADASRSDFERPWMVRGVRLIGP